MPIQAAEYSVIKTYLDLIVSLPWDDRDRRTIWRFPLPRHEVFDEDHYGLDEIKDRTCEFLAVRRLRPERKELRAADDDIRDKIRQEREGVVLCFVGPPGVGKTA